MKHLNSYSNHLIKFRQEMNRDNYLLLEDTLNHFVYFETHLAIYDYIRLLRLIVTHDNEGNKILSLLR